MMMECGHAHIIQQGVCAESQSPFATVKDGWDVSSQRCGEGGGAGGGYRSIPFISLGLRY